MNISTIDKFIGKKLKSLRESKKMTQGQLAIRLGKLLKEGKTYSYHTIRNYETGKSKFTAQILFAISQIFEVDVTYFLKDKNRIVFNSPENPDIIIELENKEIRSKFISLYNSLQKVNNPFLMDKIISLIDEITYSSKK